jgi:hypothetical protein
MANRYVEAAPTVISIEEARRRLDELAASGSSPAELERYIVDVFTERNRSIRNADFQRLDPRTVTEDYLRPRAELYRFIVVSWIRLIFLPSLKPRVAEDLFMFGLGRLFSSYNDMGVQYCTDVDLNIVAGDGMSESDVAKLSACLDGLKRSLHELFRIDLEIDPAYTLLRAREVASRLAHSDEGIRGANARFYKSNEKSISVIKDHASIREGLFSLVREEPDGSIFENFLGLKGRKPSYAKLRAGTERLPIVAEGGEKALTGAVVGSKPFDAYCRKALPPGRFVSPPDWVFSMKYFVNRVYDYVGAMRCLGHSLEAIGFDAPEPKLGADPDYRFLRNAHKLMLYLQELITIVIGSYGTRCDYSFISRSRFLRFAEINGDKFRRDFEDMVMGGDLLLHSEKKDYLELKAKIVLKARDRFIELRAGQEAHLPPGLDFETVYRDDHCMKICLPYVLSRIASRIGRIVDARLVPRLPSFGMGEADCRLYAERLGQGR